MEKHIKNRLELILSAPQSFCSTIMSFEEVYWHLACLVLPRNFVFEKQVQFIKVKNPKISRCIASVSELLPKDGEDNWTLMQGLMTEFHHLLWEDFKDK